MQGVRRGFDVTATTTSTEEEAAASDTTPVGEREVKEEEELSAGAVVADAVGWEVEEERSRRRPSCDRPKSGPPPRGPRGVQEEEEEEEGQQRCNDSEEGAEEEGEEVQEGGGGGGSQGSSYTLSTLLFGVRGSDRRRRHRQGLLGGGTEPGEVKEEEEAPKKKREEDRWLRRSGDGRVITQEAGGAAARSDDDDSSRRWRRPRPPLLPLLPFPSQCVTSAPPPPPPSSTERESSHNSEFEGAAPGWRTGEGGGGGGGADNAHLVEVSQPKISHDSPFSTPSTESPPSIAITTHHNNPQSIELAEKPNSRTDHNNHHATAATTSQKLVDTVVIFDGGGGRRDWFRCQQYYSPHSLALLFSCPVFTLCDSAVKMISASCKSQAEVFARSLQSKLHFLNGQQGKSAVQQFSPEQQQQDKLSSSLFPYPGTTFPPGRCAQFDQLRAKYYSEPDLTPAAASAGFEDEDDVGGGKGMAASDDDGNDSDLFFDFDIGSPVEGDLLEEGGDVQLQEACHDMVVDGGEDASGSRQRRGSDESDCTSTSGCGADGKNSTAYGSTSSGLCSDMDGLVMHPISSCSLENALDNDDGDGIALDPQDWLKKRSAQMAELASSPAGSNTSCSTPIATQSPVCEGSSSSPLISPDSLLEEPVGDVAAPVDPVSEQQPVSEAEKNSSAGTEASADSSLDTSKEVKEDESTPEASDAESFSVYTGEQKHKIAHSKLNALIALLEKDREYVRISPRGSPTKDTPPSSPTKKSNSRDEANPRPARSGSVSPTKKSYKCSLPTIAASPANFSFLAAAVPKSAEGGKMPHTGSFNERDSTAAAASGLLSRSESTPALTFKERELIQSPQTQRRNGAAAAAECAPVVAVPTSTKTEPQETSEMPDKLRRASSLKSGKTPPGTPGRRKIVRFADVFGLDLADVKTFLDEVPRVPKSAYKDLKNAELSDLDSDPGSDSPFFFPSYGNSGGAAAAVTSRLSSVSPVVTASSVSLVPMFNQPGVFPNFFDLLRDKKVCLENAFMCDASSIQGTVRVQNIGFHKRVSLLYTSTEWVSQAELDAKYMDGSCDGFSDKFTFRLILPAPLSPGQRLQFCLRYDVNGEKHWDNNDGKNYVFQCLGVAASAPAGPAAVNKASVGSSLPVSAGQRSHHHSTTFSHSPSAMSEEDPWLRYL